jgi:hypothetical protein
MWAGLPDFTSHSLRSRCTIREFAVDERVNALPVNEKSATDDGASNVLRPVELANRPHCRPAVSRGLSDGEKTGNYSRRFSDETFCRTP